MNSSPVCWYTKPDDITNLLFVCLFFLFFWSDLRFCILEAFEGQGRHNRNFCLIESKQFCFHGYAITQIGITRTRVAYLMTKQFKNTIKAFKLLL